MKTLLTRSASGLLFLIVMAVCILWSQWSFMAITIFVSLVMMWEFYRMLFGKQFKIQQYIGLFTGLACVLLVNGCLQQCIPTAYLFVLLLPVMAVFITQLYLKAAHPFTIIANTLLGVLYIALPVSLMAIFVFDDNTGEFNGAILLGLFIILWSCDVGAYVFGMLFGRHGKHKLFPSISPKKSWEGYFGGIVSAMLAAWIVQHFFLPFSLIHVLVIAVIIAVFGAWGDLVESMLKRSYDVKDSGKIMPGHGGLLDRFDAALIAFPVVLVYVELMGLL